MQAATFRTLAKRHTIDIGERSIGPLEGAYTFATFREFLLLFRDVCKTLTTPDDYATLAREFAREAASDGVRYSEVFVSPSVWKLFFPELNLRETFSLMRDAFDAERDRSGIETHFICDLTRNFGAERALETLESVETYRDYGVIGIGLGGDELGAPAALFEDVFSRAASLGFRRVVHAGEADGAASVKDAILLLGAERIGHGVRAIEDREVVALLRDQEIALEISPTSNMLTGAVAAGQHHPIGDLAAAGVRIALDADDPALFGTSIAQEFQLVAEIHGCAFVADRAFDAINACFAPEPRKAELRRGLAEFLLQHPPVNLT